MRTAAIGTRSSTVEYLVDNAETGLRCVAGHTVLVCLEMATFKSMPWPQIWRQRISEFEGPAVQLR